MQISELGEFGLIDHLTKNFPINNTTTKKGVGDDAAILTPTPNKQTLITSDMLMEGIHFDLTYMPLKHLGYKAAIVNFSDIYAMNGTPQQLIVNMALGRRFEVEHLEDIYAGLKLACEEYHVDLVGGDTTSSKTGLALSLTCVGEVDASTCTERCGARDTDLICVSGNLGAAYMGLQLLEREKMIFESQQGQNGETAQPDFSGREYLLERFLKPEARKDVVEALAKAGIRPTAMIDVSDGLASDIKHICKQSGVGCRIYEERIPIDYLTATTAESFNMNLTTCALNGGEDYELLFTVPLTDHEKVLQIEDVRVIGHITRQELGEVLVGRDGQEFTLKAQGWK
jgi:thiamine-monophosphate kinase